MLLALDQGTHFLIWQNSFVIGHSRWTYYYLSGRTKEQGNEDKEEVNGKVNEEVDEEIHEEVTSQLIWVSIEMSNLSQSTLQLLLPLTN